MRDFLKHQRGMANSLSHVPRLPNISSCSSSSCSLSFPHAADGEFILAFARRNVKIDNVHAAAAKRGLEWRVVDEHAEGVAGVEPVYAFTWKK